MTEEDATAAGRGEVDILPDACWREAMTKKAEIMESMQPKIRVIRQIRLGGA